MKQCLSYGIIFVILIILELAYFRLADKFNIIDKPNERSSHSNIVLRGGGIIFLLGVWVWCAFFDFHYGWFLAAVTIAAGVSFVDDIHSLPDGVRLLAQSVAMALLIWQLVLMGVAIDDCNWFAAIACALLTLIVCVGASNIYNFMDGINGITVAYSLAVAVPLLLVNRYVAFIDNSFLIVVCLALFVFSFFNFRNKGKAKCFAGDVGSVGIAYILLFAIGALAVQTSDVSWIILMLVYGVDGCLTICHRILLHEHLGEAHRKHAYQLMANELKMSHPLVSLIYMGLQLIVSLGFVLLCPVISNAVSWSLVACHWAYFGLALLVLCVAYLLFMKKYYHLHDEYLKALSNNRVI